MKIHQFALPGIALFLVGCGGPGNVVKPTDVSLDSALQQVALSINHLKATADSTPNNALAGSLVDEVDVDFVLAVSSTRTDQVSIAVTAPAGSPIGGSLGASNADTSAASRGSTIHIVLKNLATAPLNYVGCYYFINHDYGAATAKGCTSTKPDTAAAKPPAAGAKKASENSGSPLVDQAVRRFSRELAANDARLVVTDANLR